MCSSQRLKLLTIPYDDFHGTCQTAVMGHTMTLSRNVRALSAIREIGSNARALYCWLEQLDAPQIGCEGHCCLGFGRLLCILLGPVYSQHINAEQCQCPQEEKDISAVYKHVCSCSSRRFWRWHHSRPRRCSNIFGQSKKQHRLPSFLFRTGVTELQTQEADHAGPGQSPSYDIVTRPARQTLSAYFRGLVPMFSVSR